MATRREQILATAAELFARRGFTGVSVAELGAACQMSGPALYKHFASKDALLAELLDSVSAELLDGGRRAVEQSDGAVDAVRRLIAAQVDFALGRRALIVVQDRDWAHLPDVARGRVRAQQLAYIGVWADQLRRLDTTLGARTARARVQAVLGLINSTPHSARLPDVEMRALLARLAERALGLPDD